jgi:hypothetical protein
MGDLICLFIASIPTQNHPVSIHTVNLSMPALSFVQLGGRILFELQSNCGFAASAGYSIYRAEVASFSDVCRKSSQQ